MVVDACTLAKNWTLDPTLSTRVVRTFEKFILETRHTPRVISGYRTAAEQEALRRAGRPTAPDNLSNHRVCPSKAVDVSLGFPVTKNLKLVFGRIATQEGLRWGGGSPLDEESIPRDWQHLDLGPRS